MGVPLALLGASGLGTLWSVVAATSAEERLGDKPVCAPHSPAQAATTCSLWGTGSQGGRWRCWARSVLGPLWSVVSATSTARRGWGASPWCAPHSPAQTVAMQLVRSAKPEGRWSCWVRGGLRCRAWSPLLRIAACNHRAGPWL